MLRALTSAAHHAEPGSARAAGAGVGDARSYADAKQRFERNYLWCNCATEGNVADAARIAERNRTEFYACCKDR